MTLDRALAIAREAHAGQVDKAGLPVLDHVLRVVAAVEGEDAKVVAALHDVIEDCPEWTFPKLDHDEGSGREVLHALFSVTRWPGEPYSDYIYRLSQDALARTVKLADLRDHLHPDRVGALAPSHVERYRRALATLGVA